MTAAAPDDCLRRSQVSGITLDGPGMWIGGGSRYGANSDIFASDCAHRLRLPGAWSVFYNLLGGVRPWMR
jgi:hypothetical protein